MKYRPEIDGLRAIAVLAVILCHAEVRLFKGGFVGVDIFFVISGFLIGTILLNELSSGTFSISKFYERRARRILPALFAVMLCCLPFAWIWELPHQLKEFADSLIAVSLFGSNLLFAATSGYFDTASAEKALLHTWSLGVEEQFYLFFPLLLIAIWKFQRNRLIIILSTIGLISITLSEWLWRHGNEMDNFYLLPSRAWELIIGAILAIYLSKNKTNNLQTNNILSLLGLFMIFYPIFEFKNSTPTPSIWALMPTLGAALIIACSQTGTFSHKILSNKILSSIGLISYSAYLWHQPLFAFARISGNGGKPVLLILSLITLALAYLSWKFIEQPFRNKTQISAKQIFAVWLIGSIFFISTGLGIKLANGFPKRFSEEMINTTDVHRHKRYFDKEIAGMTRDFDNDSRRKILIIGDSFSRDFIKAAFSNDYLVNDDVKFIYISCRCQTYIGNEPTKSFVNSRDKIRCQKEHQKLKDAVNGQINKADIIILASRFKLWSSERLKSTIDNMHLKPSQQLFVIGTKHFGDYNLRKLLSTPRNERHKTKIKCRKLELRINETLRQNIPEKHFINQYLLLCGADGYCPAFTPNGDVFSYDGGHFTVEAAKFAGRELFTKTKLKAIL